MPILAIIENGIVANVIVADAWPNSIDVTDVTPRPGPGWAYDGATFTPPPASQQPEPDPNPDGSGPLLSNYAFDMRYTLPERIAIERLALQKNEDGEFTDTALGVQVNLERAKKAKYTDPNYEPTRKGVMMFVTLGALTAARALEILDAPILPHEEWRAQ